MLHILHPVLTNSDKHSSTKTPLSEMHFIYWLALIGGLNPLSKQMTANKL